MPDRPYLFIRDMPGERNTVFELAQEVERRGLPGVWAPSTGDNLALLLAVLDRTERIDVGSGIAHIYLQHPYLMAHAASLIEELHPGRFTLGIGVSHGPSHARFGLSVGKPLTDTRYYVERMREAVGDAPFPRLVLAALRTRMTALSGEIAEGAIWANGVRSHLASSLERIPAERRADFLVGNLVVTAIADNRADAVAAARRGMLNYFRLPNYQAYFEEAGYGDEAAAARVAMERGGAEEDLLAAISERFLADACLVGTAGEVRDQAAAFMDAGVTHLVLTPVSARGHDAAMTDALEAFS